MIQVVAQIKFVKVQWYNERGEGGWKFRSTEECEDEVRPIKLLAKGIERHGNQKIVQEDLFTTSGRTHWVLSAYCFHGLRHNARQLRLAAW